MLFIGGISQGSKALSFPGSLMCKFCGSMSRCQIVMTFYCFSFFFIPLFKWNRRYYVTMSCCQAVYELNPEVGKAIARGEQVQIRNEDLQLVQDGKRTYGFGAGSGEGQDAEAPDPAKKLRCPICKYEAPGDSNYCPKCGQRLR